jgi:hypothetical protein
MASEDMDEVNSDIKLILKDRGIPESKENIFKMVKELINKNLHIVQTYSPVGVKLRNRVR